MNDKNHKKLGLALGSGAWRGLFHIGVLKSLDEHQISVDFIAGSSAGSLVGGLYATLGNAKALEEIVVDLKYRDLLKVLLNPVKGKSTIGKDNGLEMFLREIVGKQKIEDLKIKFCAVASDLLSGDIVKINKGDLVTAISASSSIPGVFKPVMVGESYCFDGGLIMPIPVSVVKEMGADITVGVNLYNGVFPLQVKVDKLSRLKAASISRFLPLNKLANENLKMADIIFNPRIPKEDYGFFLNFLKHKEIIRFGKEYTDKQIPKILEVLS